MYRRSCHNTIILDWYSRQEIIKKIEQNEPQKAWFRLVLLEVMLFETYYALGLDQDKKGQLYTEQKMPTVAITDLRV